jgi:hypothetical protein
MADEYEIIGETCPRHVGTILPKPKSICLTEELDNSFQAVLLDFYPSMHRHCQNQAIRLSSNPSNPAHCPQALFLAVYEFVQISPIHLEPFADFGVGKLPFPDQFPNGPQCAPKVVCSFGQG